MYELVQVLKIYRLVGRLGWVPFPHNSFPRAAFPRSAIPRNSVPRGSILRNPRMIHIADKATNIEMASTCQENRRHHSLSRVESEELSRVVSTE